MAAATANRWKLGLFVVTGIGVAFATVLFLGSQRLKKETFDIVTYFDESVQGLEIGSPVKFRGVSVGSVKEIGIGPDRRHIEVVMEMDIRKIRRLKIRAGDSSADATTPSVDPRVRAQLVSAGITGLKFVQADFFDAKTHPVEKLPFETPRNAVPSVPSTLKNVEEAVMDAVNYVPAIAKRLEELLKKLDQLVVDLDAARLRKQAGDLLATAEAELRAANLGALSTTLTATVAEGREVLDALRRMLKAAQDEDGSLRALNRIDRAAAALEKAIKDTDLTGLERSLRKTSDGIGESAGSVAMLAEELRAELRAAREALEGVRDLAATLERDPSALIHGTVPEAAPFAGAGGK